MKTKGFDVIIIGGGVIGSSIAYNLLNDGFDATVTVLEKDPTYEYASSPRSLGGIRQQFSTDINVRICLYGIRTIEHFDEEMAVDGEPARANYHPHGYLLLAGDRNYETLQRNYRLQRSLGVDVDYLSPVEIKEIIPHMKVDKLCGGYFGRRAGYMDPFGLLQGYLRKAKSLGAAYIKGEVVDILRRGDRVSGIRTADGKILKASVVVIAAGAWAAEVAAMAGVQVPIEPKPQMAFCFDPAEKFDYDLPFVFDPEGYWFRHETGKQIFTGNDRQAKPGFKIDWDPRYFEETLWPQLAGWVPSFERLKLIRGWGGLYAVNRLDHNALIGAYPGIDGLYIAGGL